MEQPSPDRWSIRGVCRQVLEMDPVDLALRLTLLDLLLRPIGDWTLRPFILSLASLGLLLPHQQRRLGLWLALTFLTGLRVVLDWPLADIGKGKRHFRPVASDQRLRAIDSKRGLEPGNNLSGADLRSPRNSSHTEQENTCQ